MKLHVLLAVVALHGTFCPRSHCKAANGPEPLRARLGTPRPAPPMVVRPGEECSTRPETPRQGRQRYPSRAGAVSRGLRLNLAPALHQDPAERRQRRADEMPLSLDLTFLLLREVLEMARAQQLAQRASSNRKMMDFFGKK